MKAIIGLAVVAIVGIWLAVSITSGGTPKIPPSIGVPVELSEPQARQVLRDAILDDCFRRSPVITFGMSRSLRVASVAKAMENSDHWAFSYDGNRARVYQSGAVTGDLLRDLVSICKQGNRV